MPSLTILILVTLASMAILAWLLSFVAQMVGSIRARFVVGVRAVLMIVGINILFAVAGGFAVSYASAPRLAIAAFSLGLMIAQLAVVFLTLMRTFDLPPLRTLALFGTYLGFGAIQLLLAFAVVRPYVVEAFVMPTHSMSPTIEPGDRILANKLLAPRRWDLVVYLVDIDGRRQAWVKRLVALPGERLRFDGGDVFINDQSVPVPPVLAGKCHAKLPGAAMKDTRYFDGDTIALGSEEYFFIGDNIDISADSRTQGPSKASAIIGVVDMLYWPPRKIRIVR